MIEVEGLAKVGEKIEEEDEWSLCAKPRERGGEDITEVERFEGEGDGDVRRKVRESATDPKLEQGTDG